MHLLRKDYLINHKNVLAVVIFGLYTILLIAFLIIFLGLPFRWQLLFWMLPIFVSTGLFIFIRRTDWLLWSLMVLTPLDTFLSRVLDNYGIFSQGTLIKDGLVFLLLVAILVKGVAHITKRNNKVTVHSIDVLIFIFATFLLLRIMLSPNIVAGLFGLRGVLWFSVVFYYIKLFSDAQTLKKLVTISLIMSGFVALYGILQLYLGAEIFLALGYKPGDVAFRTTGGFIRIISTTDSAGTLATYSMIWVCFTFSVAIYRKGWIRITLFVLASLLVVNMILTTVRAAWVALALGLLVGWLVNNRVKLWSVLLFPFGLALLITINSVSNGFLVTRVLSIVGIGNDQQSFQSNENHLLSFQRGLKLFSENPLWGLGVGTTGIPSNKYADVLPEGYIALDNYYLKLLVEIGIGGFVLFMILLAVALWFAYIAHSRNVDGIQRGVALGVLMALVGLVFMNSLHSILESPLINVTFWLLFSFIFLTLRYSSSSIAKNV